MVHYIGKVVLI